MSIISRNLVIFILQTIQTLDTAVMLFIQNDVRTELLNFIMIFFTYLGEAGLVWLLVAAGLIISKKHRKAGVMLVASIAFCYIINDITLKHLITRPRPFLVIPGFEALIAEPASYSFPSGHACSSFAAAFALRRGLGKKGGWFYALAALIALSRPYVGVHYLSDILAGAVIGTLGALLAFALFERYYRRLGEIIPFFAK